ncbi:MAG: carbohydrate ABC transporter permease [Arthrobacter sp.]|uniref:carbohydrate ABC transporter permease n=1 Tax=unclassified Arthrobacter TaxID=235627 RepID=UPI0026531053|nr:carbohydrate ABC transporter permease [Micrococcaceae bacterium]MDN5824974.1 carbohydrate ABC transporter permease [Micrococcaceae bacterium]MDN5878930.1 carbohydrate ABC transporter permease [Micrococcaceae bacterium]MDN5886349.1 carbohydrate ABC transporter permease [Micrococcaceae bacterium]MDN6170922.1 carbohydrate ABC transporter permease [Micrococcaceae bacterium]
MALLTTEDHASRRVVVGRMTVGLIVAAIFLIPYAVMFIGSLKTRSEILSVPPDYLPRDGAQWSNYLTMWDTPETPVAYNLISTVVIAVAATLLVLLVAMPAAYYSARFKYRGKMAFMFLVIVTQMLQPAILTVGLFKEMLVFNLYDTWLAMILINAAFNLAFAVWIMHTFFAGVPKEVDEAAQLDGAGKLRVLFTVNLPLVWPGIVTALIFTFVACWNEFAASLVILSTAENQPLSVALTRFVGQYSTAWQYVFGVSIVAILPVIILFMLIEKRLIGGLAAGATK